MIATRASVWNISMQSLATSRVVVGQLALHGGGAVGVDGGCTWHSHVRNNLVGEFGQVNSRNSHHGCGQQSSVSYSLQTRIGRLSGSWYHDCKVVWNLVETLARLGFCPARYHHQWFFRLMVSQLCKMDIYFGAIKNTIRKIMRHLLDGNLTLAAKS